MIPQSPTADKSGTTMRIALLLLLFVAVLFGLLEVHSSTDTWIGLAAGREIAATGHVPTTDSFSYTAAGHPWINQNWLTHAIQYNLDSRIAPDAVVWFNWLLVLVIIGASGWAARRRTGSTDIALLAAAITAVGCRDFVSPRPATVGIFCFAVTWALLSDPKFPRGTRAIPRLLFLVALLNFWDRAHGTSPLGYLLFATAMIGEAIAQRRENPGAPFPWWQTAWIPALVGMFLANHGGPTGITRLTTMGGTSYLSSVSEWTSPFLPARFPSPLRLWIFLGAAVVLVLMTLRMPKVKKPKSPPVPLLFDLVTALVVLAMAFRARRFIPLVFLVGPTILASFALPRWRMLPGAARGRLRTVGLYGTIVMAGLFAGLTFQYLVHDRAREPAERPCRNLLEWVTAAHELSNDAIDYLAKNELAGNLFCEWTQAGSVTLAAPAMKVYIDGRAQQVFDERIYDNYRALLAKTPVHADQVTNVLDGRNADGSPGPGKRTDAILLRDNSDSRDLWRVIDLSGRWVPVLLTPDAVLYGRSGGAWLQSIRRRIDAGTEWRPEFASAGATRGNVLLATSPPDTLGALRAYLEGVFVDPTIGVYAYPTIDHLMRGLGRRADADSFLASERVRIREVEPPLPAGDREKLDRLLAGLKGR